MKKSAKRLLITLAALGLSAPAFAESMVQVPSQHGGFKVGIDALYLQPSNSDLTYATLLLPLPGNFPGASVTSEQNAMVDPNYEWGFYAQIGYLFPCTGNDLTLGYTRLRINAENSIDRPADEDGMLFITAVPLSTIFEPTTVLLAFFEGATGKASFNLDAVDLEGGQRFTTGTFDMRMFAGVRYAKLDHKLQTRLDSDLNIPDVELMYTAFGNQSFNSDFKGIGPRLGVDSRYCFNSGFGLDASVSASLLLGNIDKSYQASGELHSITSDVVANFESASSSEWRVVPNIEAKLGVDYIYPIKCSCTKSALVFEAGYQASSYFNAIDHTTIIAPEGDTFAYQGTTTDVTFDGIYLGVKYYA